MSYRYQRVFTTGLVQAGWGFRLTKPLTLSTHTIGQKSVVIKEIILGDGISYAICYLIIRIIDCLNTGFSLYKPY